MPECADSDPDTWAEVQVTTRNLARQHIISKATWERAEAEDSHERVAAVASVMRRRGAPAQVLEAMKACPSLSRQSPHCNNRHRPAPNASIVLCR